MNAFSVAKKVKARLNKKIREAKLSSGVTIARDARIVRRIVSGGNPAGAALVVAPPGGGNIGDQALLEAFFENVSGKIEVIARERDDVAIPSWCEDRVVVHALPKLVYGIDKSHRADVIAFAKIVGSSSSLSIIGADIMDGRYSLVASTNRASLASAASRAGVPTRILGFSWSPKARRVTKKTVAAAAKAGVAVMLRDPISAQRAMADGIAPVKQTADIVFSATAVDDSTALLLDDRTRPIALVNVSGLISKTAAQTDEYAYVVRDLIQNGMTVVLLPHVSTFSTNDIAECRKVYDVVNNDQVILIDRILTPAKIRGLVARSEIVITGRMHLGVIAISARVPAITLATQGKVEGLMSLFDTPELCVEPVTGFSRVVMPLAREILGNPERWRQRLDYSLGTVVQLARSNFEGLPQKSAATEGAGK